MCVCVYVCVCMYVCMYVYLYVYMWDIPKRVGMYVGLGYIHIHIQTYTCFKQLALISP